MKIKIFTTDTGDLRVKDTTRPGLTNRGPTMTKVVVVTVMAAVVVVVVGVMVGVVMMVVKMTLVDVVYKS